jgi:Phage tail assembly chaperone
MFVVTQNPTFLAPVIAHLPGDGGKFKKVQFSVVFKALSKEAVDALLERIRRHSRAVTVGTDSEPVKDREVLDEVLAGFGPDLVEEDRTPMAFTPANVERLCSIYPIESAIVKSFFDNFISGPAKN